MEAKYPDGFVTLGGAYPNTGFAITPGGMAYSPREIRETFSARMRIVSEDRNVVLWESPGSEVGPWGATRRNTYDNWKPGRHNTRLSSGGYGRGRWERYPGAGKRLEPK